MHGNEAEESGGWRPAHHGRQPEPATASLRDDSAPTCRFSERCNFSNVAIINLIFLTKTRRQEQECGSWVFLLLASRMRAAEEHLCSAAVPARNPLRGLIRQARRRPRKSAISKPFLCKKKNKKRNKSTL